MFKFLKNLAKLIFGLPLAVCATVLIGTTAMFFTGWSVVEGHMRKNKGRAKTLATDKSLEGIADGLWGALGAVWGFSLAIVSEPISAFADYSIDKKVGLDTFSTVNISKDNDKDGKKAGTDKKRSLPKTDTGGKEMNKGWKKKPGAEFKGGEGKTGSEAKADEKKPVSEPKAGERKADTDSSKKGAHSPNGEEGTPKDPPTKTKPNGAKPVTTTPKDKVSTAITGFVK